MWKVYSISKVEVKEQPLYETKFTTLKTTAVSLIHQNLNKCHYADYEYYIIMK